MPSYFSFCLRDRGLDHAAFVLCRNSLSVNGDLESGFFDGVAGLQAHPDPGFGVALTAACAAAATRVVVVIRNPSLVLDDGLGARIAAAIAAVPEGMDWALAGAGGLGPDSRRYLALYASATPAIPDTSGPHPLIDVMPDLYLVEAGFLREVLSGTDRPLDAAAEPVLAARGYLAGRVSLFLPQLSAGIDGGLAARDLVRLERELAAHLSSKLPGQTVPTLSGDIAVGHPAADADPGPAGSHLMDLVTALVRGNSDPVSLSIVTRTRFQRPALLRRLLASISRARRPEIDLEIILSTDAPAQDCAEQFEALRRDFLPIELRLCHNPDTAGPSRITNLLSGISAARNDYVAIVDDDDYLDLFAFERLLPAFFCANRPLIVTSSEVHEERWEETPSGRGVLAHSRVTNSYPAEGWRRMFTGVNRLPVCALIIPRALLQARLSAFRFRHDLSEDYALSLLLLTDPALPAIHQIDGVFCHISLRGRENSVTMEDRRPWVRDIAAYLSDLTADPAVAPPGLWTLLAPTDAADAIGKARAMEDLRAGLDRRAAELRVLERENQQLRAQLRLQEPAS